jgi:ATP-dependent RNA helicase RhlE
MSFQNLGLSSALTRAAADAGYVEPTPIQWQAIPAALAGRDVLGAAETGSGKTAAFALSLLQRLKPVEPTRGERRSTQALVLVPTRELAAQVGEAIQGLARHLGPPVRIEVAFGGVSINPQMLALRGGADVVVATPGRLLDLVEHNAVSLNAVSMLVLDEADRLLDAGFADELARIVALLPKRRQNLLFSATLPPGVQTLAQSLLNDPLRIDAIAERTDQAPLIEQHVVEVDAKQRTQLLRHLMHTGNWTQVLVFVATQYATELVAMKLGKLGVKTAPFHGAQSQGKRTQVLADFKAGRVQVVIATDMAARGIHIDQLPVVVNYDLPRSPDEYVHRIGRTGRAGERGLAVSFVSADTEAHFRLIEKRQGQRVPRDQIGGFEPVDAAAPGASTGGIKGKRKSKKDKLREAAG